MPETWRLLDEATQLRLGTLTESINAETLDDTLGELTDHNAPAALHAVAVPELKDGILASFAKLNDWQKIAIISRDPQPEFADEAIRLYAEASSFREAERLGTTVMLPIASNLKPAQIEFVLQSIQDNGQIWYASETPSIVEKLFESTAQHHVETKAAWQRLMSFFTDREGHFSYPGLRQRLESQGWWPSDEDSTMNSSP